MLAKAEFNVPESTLKVPSLLTLTPKLPRLTIPPLPPTEKVIAASSADCASRSEPSASSGPPPVPLEFTANCALTSLIAVLYAETNWLIASEALEVSGATLSVTGVFGDGELKFSVTPLITPVTVFEVLLIGTPSTTSEALSPVTALLKLRLVVFAETLRSPAAPVVWLTSASRAPFASLITLALTPSPWLLIAAASPLIVASVEFTVVAGLVPT